MPKIPDCDSCQYYAHNYYLVCALHPNGLEDSNCPNFSPETKLECENLGNSLRLLAQAESENELFLNDFTEIMNQHSEIERENELLSNNFANEHPANYGSCEEVMNYLQSLSRPWSEILKSEILTVRTVPQEFEKMRDECLESLPHARQIAQLADCRVLYLCTHVLEEELKMIKQQRETVTRTTQAGAYFVLGVIFGLSLLFNVENFITIAILIAIILLLLGFLYELKLHVVYLNKSKWLCLIKQAQV